MPRLQFKMYIDEGYENHWGINTEFTDGKGNWSSCKWSNPPDNIDDVDIYYIKDRHNNVDTKYHVEFVKKMYKEEMQKFERFEECRFRRISG